MESWLRRIASPEQVELARGEHLFRQGDAVTHLFIVRRGRVRLERSSEDGNPVVLQLALEPEMVAEASLFSDRYHCAAVAAGSAAVLRFARAPVLETLARDPGMAREVLALYARRIQRLRALLEVRNIRSAQDRILAWLRLEADEAGRIQVRSSLKDMAWQLGLAHETFYRALRELESRGHIAREAGALCMI